MENKRIIKTTITEIVKYLASQVDECDLSVDFREAHERCWRCGYKSRLERCHIVPHSLGGLDTPENLVLLCCLCHAEGPNIADPDFIWDWLKAHQANFMIFTGQAEVCRNMNLSTKSLLYRNS